MSEDPYGNAEAAAITRSATLSIDAEGARQRSEEWSVAPAAGGTLNLSLDFAGGPQNWAPSEARVFSNTIDGFNRTYRYRQLAGLVSSASVGKPLVGDVSYTSDIIELAAIFDGSETLVAILDIPVYARDIFLP